MEEKEKYFLYYFPQEGLVFEFVPIEISGGLEDSRIIPVVWIIDKDGRRMFGDSKFYVKCHRASSREEVVMKAESMGKIPTEVDYKYI